MWRAPFGQRRSRQNLASALVGEISATIEVLETSFEIKRLEALSAGESVEDDGPSHFALPKSVIYESNASQLSLFNSPLPREVSYFYTELASISERVRRAMERPQSPELRKGEATQALSEIERVMALGEQVLHDLRPFVSHRQPATITRA